MSKDHEADLITVVEGLFANSSPYGLLRVIGSARIC